ncbi:MMPL family transporter [Nocardioides sp. WS12]|uniref:MMPL family transporter n=1 Tax=Nocardioides sp. WS12 TaxID=2486272 RepID=UPI0015F84AFA|nr:MMPL family transporter [Nocardioides sp. WS12]
MNTRLRFLVAVALVVAAGAWAAIGLSRLEVDSDLESLLPANDPAVEALAGMAQQFGGDPVVVLVEGGGDPLDKDRLPRLLQLEGELSALDDVVATFGPATTLNQIALRVKQLLAELSGQRDALKQAGRTKELAQFERRYGTLLVQAMPAGLPTLSNADFVQSVVKDPKTGKVRPLWRQYLPADETVAIYLRPRENLDEKAAAAMAASVREVLQEDGAVPDGADTTVTGAPVVSVGLADRLRSEVPRLALTAFAVVALALLLVPWTRRRRWRLAPLLVMAGATAGTLGSFGWRDEPLSLGAATFLPIILGLGSYYPVYLSRTGHRRVVLAVAVSSALAFAGLLLSPLPFVAELGYAVPVGLGLVVAFSLLAAWVRPGLLDAAEEPALARNPKLSWSMPRGLAIGVVLVGVLGAGVGWGALAVTDLKTDPQQLLAGLPALEEAVHVEEVVGFSAEVDIRLIGANVLTPEALAWSRTAEQEVVTQFGDRVQPVVTVSGLLSFLGEKPSAEQVEAGVNALPSYVSSAVVSLDRRQALASYGVAWTDLADDRNLMRSLEDALPPPPAGYRVEVSGLPAAAERGYDLVDGERYQASVIALLASAIALVLLLPNRRDALLALLAAAIATGLSIALLVAVIGALNPLTLALGALTAAVGSEFTVLLLAARRAEDPAMQRSVMLAVLLSLGGYGVLLTSSLPVLRELGLALSGSVALSVLIALALATLRAGQPTPPSTVPLSSNSPEAHHEPVHH